MQIGDIDILISARDKASANLKNVARNSDELGESFKRVNQGGGISAALDVLGLEQYSGALGTAVDQMGDLISAQEAGKESLTALKVGAGVAAAAVGIQLTRSLLGAIANQKELNSEISRFGQLANEVNSLANERLQRSRDEVSKLADPSFEKLKLLQEQMRKLSQEKIGIAPQVKKLREELDKFPSWWTDATSVAANMLGPGAVPVDDAEARLLFGGRDEQRNLIQQQLETQEKLLELNRQEFRSVARQIEQQKELLKIRREQFRTGIKKGLTEGAGNIRKFFEDTMKRTFEAADKARDARRDALIKKTEGEISVLERAALKVKEQIANQREQLNEINERDVRSRNDALTRQAGPVNAVQSRFLTRGVVQADPVLKENERQTKLQKDIKKAAENLVQIMARIEEKQDEIAPFQFEIIE